MRLAPHARAFKQRWVFWFAVHRDSCGAAHSTEEGVHFDFEGILVPCVDQDPLRSDISLSPWCVGRDRYLQTLTGPRVSWL
jgi:hypothetical protein